MSDILWTAIITALILALIHLIYDHLKYTLTPPRTLS